MNKLTSFLGNIINRFLGSYSDAVDGLTGNGKDNEWMEMVKTLVRIVDQFMPIAMIVVGMVGSIYVIILGIQYSKSENEEAKAEAKKKLINGAVGIGIGLLLMLVLTIFLKNSKAITDWLWTTGGVPVD